MKHRLSITVEQETALAIQEALRLNHRRGIFQNKSQLIEHSIKSFLGESCSKLSENFNNIGADATGDVPERSERDTKNRRFFSAPYGVSRRTISKKEIGRLPPSLLKFSNPAEKNCGVKQTQGALHC